MVIKGMEGLHVSLVPILVRDTRNLLSEFARSCHHRIAQRSSRSVKVEKEVATWHLDGLSYNQLEGPLQSLLPRTRSSKIAVQHKILGTQVIVR